MNRLLYSSLVVSIVLALVIVIIPIYPAIAATTESKLTAGDGATGDSFGQSVAVSGDTMVVGAWGDDDLGTNAGSAYVYTRSGTTWTQQAKLQSSDGMWDDKFGYSVAISGDTLVVGAYADDEDTYTLNSGSVYIFTRSGTTWTEQAKLTDSEGAANDYFGYSVAIDDDTLVIGTYGDDDDAYSENSGSVFIYTRSSNIWTQQVKLTASDGEQADYFGYSVAISDDTVAIGTHGDDDGAFASGAAYVFTRSGTTWTQQAKILASDPKANHKFGVSVAISGDNIVVGAWGDDDNGGISGAVYGFTRSGTTWTQQAKITADDGVTNDYFGLSVALSDDTLVAGAWGVDNTATTTFDTGSTYVFTRSGTTWIQQPKILASDGSSNSRFGLSVAVSGDTVVVGALGDNSNTGAAYVFGQQSAIEQAPDVTSINPASANKGDTLNVVITGTYFTGATAVSLGSGVTVNNYSVDSSTQITANVTVSGIATSGIRPVSITTPAGSDTLSASFTIEQETQSTADAPAITSVSPASGKQGNTLTVTITGTYFTGATAVSLGSGISTNSYTVVSSTRITANITIAADATQGTRTVTVTTPIDNDTLSGGFAVEEALTEPTPTNGGGCGASAAVATSEAIASSFGLLGFLSVSGLYVGHRQKKRKSK
ncbi:MAG: hypothetical protein HN929_03190 [Chloroflexi bacterium]|jgi:hypothetical protein|nr:hypothetical protein [Chloroflexota bacterium]MBT7080465.1 hypothetical protein [Chloroflexota bacterium]MBT7289168.1 hypothetical protein [Chloroflexota bacterium]